MNSLRAKVTSKGQVTLPKQLREAMGIGEGDRILFAIQSPYEARLVIDKRPGASGGIMSHLAGEGAALPVSEIDSAAKRFVAAKFEREAGAK